MKIYLKGEKDINPIAAPIYGMAVIDKSLSGLPYDIWLDPAGDRRNTRHNSPRLKVNVDGVLIPYTIGDIPKQAVSDKRKVNHENKIIRWIQQNKDILLKQWRCEISDKEALDLVKKLE